VITKNNKIKRMHEILNFFRKHPPLTAMSLVSIFSFPLQEVILPMYYGKWMENIKDSSIIVRCSFIIVGLWILAIGLRVLYDYTELKVNSMLESHVREESYKKLLQYLEVHPEEEINRMELITQLTKYPLFNTEIYTYVIESIVPSILLLLFVGGYIFFVNKWLFLVFTSVVLTIIVVSLLIVPRIVEQSKKRDNEHNSIMSTMEDILNNSPVVYVQGTMDQELRVIDHQETRFRGIYEAYSLNLLIYRNVILVILLCTIFYIIYYAYHLYKRNEVGTGTIITFFLIFTFWISDVLKLFNILAYLIYTMGNMRSTEDKIAHILNSVTVAPTPPSIPPSMTPTPTASVYLCLKNIGFRHRDQKKWILKDLSLNLRKGTTTILRGSVGSGKTTLLKIVLGLLEIDEGEMMIDGGDGIKQRFYPTNSREWRKNFTYMSQEVILFDRSLYENLVYGHSITRQECMDLLEEYGYVPLLVKKLQDLDRQVGKDGSNLSGGQRKLVILFRCLLSSCSSSSKTMIVMDEPTSNLDTQTHGLVLRLIELLSKKETMLIISHDDMLFKKYTTVDIGLLNKKNKS